MNAEYLLSQIVELEAEISLQDSNWQDAVDSLNVSANEEKLNRIAAKYGPEVADDVFKIIREETDSVNKLTKDINSAHAQTVLSLTSEIAALKEQLEPLIIEQAKSVKVPGLMAVFTQGRVTWDSKWLDGYRSTHPEVDTARKVGNPSVSYRRG